MKRLVLGVGAAPPPAPDTAWVRWEGEDTALPVPDEDAARGEIDEAAIAWTKGWGRRPLVDGRCFRDLLEWDGVSLWWFAELYLHHGTSCPRWVRMVEVAHRLLDAHVPDEVETVGLPAADALLVGRVCTARAVLFLGPQRAPSRGGAVARVRLRARWNGVKLALGAVKAVLAGRPPRPRADDGRGPVLFLSHAAFWKDEREHYFDALIPALAGEADLRPFVVAVGPEAAHRRRGAGERLREWARLPWGRAPYVPVSRYTSGRVLARTRAATRRVRQAWRTLRRLPAAQAAFSHRGAAFFDLAEADLAATLLLQLPWAVRSYEEMAQALAVVRPRALVLYAESSGWGRAALAAARAAGVPSIALQHGILYPTYFSYRHEPGEEACPRPTVTAVFGEAARRFLVEKGGYAPESLVLTGSPRFDDLLRRARERDRGTLRGRLGVRDGEALVAVASRYRPIRRTHRAVGAVFADLVRAVEAVGAQARVKPHPAEPPEAYAADLRGQERVRLLEPGLDLLDLLHAADVLVTVESLSAVEALVLGRPVVVLNMPSNLRDLVEAGVALGVPAGDDPAAALRAALEPATREALAAARARYLSDFALGVDGQATARILGLIRRTAVIGSNR
jgi:glycosyltransferase involved in cell wall biosynthesis